LSQFLFFMVFFCHKFNHLVGSSSPSASPSMQFKVLCTNCWKTTITFPCLGIEFDPKHINLSSPRYNSFALWQGRFKHDWILHLTWDLTWVKCLKWALVALHLN
jgi:hypothetical protein